MDFAGMVCHAGIWWTPVLGLRVSEVLLHRRRIMTQLSRWIRQSHSSKLVMHAGPLFLACCLYLMYITAVISDKVIHCCVNVHTRESSSMNLFS